VGSGSGGGQFSTGCWGWSQFLNKVCCAAMDLALAHLCRSLAALTEASHCFLSLCVSAKVWVTVSWNNAFDSLGISFVPMLYCSRMFALTSRSLTLFGCFWWSLSFWWSHCCCACLSIHFKTSVAHFVLDCQSYKIF